LVNYLKNVEGLTGDSIVNQLIGRLGPDDVPVRLLMPLPPELDEIPLFEPNCMGINNQNGEFSHV